MNNQKNTGEWGFLFYHPLLYLPNIQAVSIKKRLCILYIKALNMRRIPKAFATTLVHTALLNGFIKCLYIKRSVYTYVDVLYVAFTAIIYML